MHTLKNVFDSFTSENNAVKAVVLGTKKKRNNRAVQKLISDTDWHQIDPEKAKRYVRPIVEELKAGEWIHSMPRYKNQLCAAAAGSKERNLYIPNLKDHVVHHMLIQATEEAFMRGMHPHCCGSVPGRGIKHVIKTVRRWMQTDKECRYFVKLDIRHFFDSIDRDIMKRKLSEKIADKRILEIFDQILCSAPVCCPIGYYPSPWLSNLYLQDMDWFIEQQLYKERRGKRIKYVRHYLRYADDMLLIGTSKTDLRKAVFAVRDYLRDELKLELKNTWEIKRIGKHEDTEDGWKLKKGTYWCDIGGYKFCKDAMMIRGHLFLKASRMARKMSRRGYWTEHQCHAINARIAWAEQAGSVNFIEKYIKPYINIKLTRRIIGDVDQIRKFRTGQTGRSDIFRGQGYCQPQFQIG